MTADEVMSFLTSQRRVIVAALDGGVPVGTVADARVMDGLLVVTLRGDDIMVDLLVADERVCVIAEQFSTYHEIKGVAAHGRARFASEGATTFHLTLDDLKSFDFGKLPQAGSGSGAIPA